MSQRQWPGFDGQVTCSPSLPGDTQGPRGGARGTGHRTPEPGLGCGMAVVPVGWAEGGGQAGPWEERGR